MLPCSFSRTSRTAEWPAWCPSWLQFLGPLSCWTKNPAKLCWSTPWSKSLNATYSKSTVTTSNRTGGCTSRHRPLALLCISDLNFNPFLFAHREPDLTFFDQMIQPIVMYRWLQYLLSVNCVCGHLEKHLNINAFLSEWSQLPSISFSAAVLLLIWELFIMPFRFVHVLSSCIALQDCITNSIIHCALSISWDPSWKTLYEALTATLFSL